MDRGVGGLDELYMGLTDIISMDSLLIYTLLLNRSLFGATEGEQSEGVLVCAAELRAERIMSGGDKHSGLAYGREKTCCVQKHWSLDVSSHDDR